MVEQRGVGWAMLEATDEPDINVISNTTLFDFEHKLLPVGRCTGTARQAMQKAVFPEGL